MMPWLNQRGATVPHSSCRVLDPKVELGDGAIQIHALAGTESKVQESVHCITLSGGEQR